VRVHIPDGFIAPQLYLPAYGLAAGLWTFALRRLRASLQEETLPRLAVLTAFCFVLMLIMVPLPGGTSVHASGVALLAILFGVWSAFLAISLVLLIQALLFGAGGVTALAVNALAMGLVGSAVARGAYLLLRGFRERLALVAAGWLSVNVSAC
jgi:cobalt/nickel transport system permease protein